MNQALDPQQAQLAEFRDDVLAGLSRAQKTLSPRWLYDQKGSQLFEQITELPEYYVTRTEVALLGEIVADFAAEIGARASVVEYGAGAATKIKLLLDALAIPTEYVAIDISYAHLREAVKPIASQYPNLKVRPVAGDFLDEITLTEPLANGPKVGFFPGSTIGNMSDVEINAFLGSARRLLGANAYMLLGADLRKSPDVLCPAYDDAAGITAAFNKNLLTRINRELGGNIALENFEHRAVWAEENSRIEMHLVSNYDQRFNIAGHEFTMWLGETIHTENSRKFGRQDLENLASTSGWSVNKYATDADNYFAVLLLQASPNV